MDERNVKLRTRDWLAKYNIKLKKSLGQNFLSNEKIIEKILAKLNLSEEDTIIEIGAGAGILTEALARKAGKIIAYEIDQSLKPLLKDRLRNFENVELIFEDFLKSDLSILQRIDNLSYIANIPYFITSPIIEKILLESPKFKFAVLMVQKELAERIVSPHGCKKFGAISFFVQYFCKVEKLLEISRAHFIPNPKIDSVVIKLTPIDRANNIEELAKLFRFSRKLFSQRRKMLKNILVSMGYSKEKIELLHTEIDLRLRPENLSVEKIVELYRTLER